ncbi:hypothetical protein Nepgr_030698 [Nepenthes gracilis]|uniref:G-patch domain-containing protein n=1 Tax=Nepenthes gracilis TaxID=150966 RepID=A0AAD3TFX8_NEPGR|nr:hypothetical protein Nepgr_030698 [Nepenthes gracilis]
MAAPEVSLRYVGIEKRSAAFRLMKQMGWEEGEGLGKDKQGIRGYVRVQNKQDTSGIGLEKANNWAFDTRQFDSILRNLKVQAAEPNGEDKQDKLDQVVAGACESQVTPKPAVNVTRPRGRYKKREMGKLVNTYSSQDLKGILVKSDQPTGVSQDEESESAEKPESCVRDSEGDSMQWWGHKHGFVSGGFLGAKAKKRKAIVSDKAQNCNKRTCFAEEDQENLYKLVQDKSSTGKQGLGVKDKPPKIAGCRYQGKKMTFNGSDSEDSSNIASPMNKEHGQMLEMDKHDEPKLKLKLKKLSRQLLRQVPDESLKLKQLKVLIDQHTDSIFTDFTSGRAALSFLKQKLQGSSRFSVEGKRVRLLSKKR